MSKPDGEAGEKDGGVHPVYVNHCDIAADLSDARLVFAQAGDGQSKPRIKAHLVTSPTHLKRFRDAITDACREHDERFADDCEPSQDADSNASDGETDPSWEARG